MAIVVLMLACGALAALAAWQLIQFFQKEYVRYRMRFESDAVHGLADFFLFLDPSALWGVNLAVALVPAGAFLLMGAEPLVVAVTASVGMMLPRALLGHARRRRLHRIDAQFPDFLLALAGALRAGSGMQSGLHQVAQHAARPLSLELNLILQQQRMGLSFTEALDALHARVPTESTGLVVAAIKVAVHTGGSLAETLERISHTLRTRLQLQGKIRALTSQGRMQAWIMAGLPFLLVFALHALDPESMRPLWSTAAGWVVIAFVAVLEVAGLYMVRRIVNIDV
jgi:tight adherence protein B